MNGAEARTPVRYLVQTEWETLALDGAQTERLAQLVPLATDIVMHVLERLLNETIPEEVKHDARPHWY